MFCWSQTLHRAWLCTLTYVKFVRVPILSRRILFVLWSCLQWIVATITDSKCLQPSHIDVTQDTMQVTDTSYPHVCRHIKSVHHHSAEVHLHVVAILTDLD